MNGLTVNAPWWQTGFTTFTPALPPRQRGFVVSAFPSSRLTPVVAWPFPNRRRGLRGRTKAVPRIARISPAVCNGSCGPRRHPSRVACAGVRFSQRMRQRP